MPLDMCQHHLLAKIQMLFFTKSLCTDACAAQMELFWLFLILMDFPLHPHLSLVDDAACWHLSNIQSTGRDLLGTFAASSWRRWFLFAVALVVPVASCHVILFGECQDNNVYLEMFSQQLQATTWSMTSTDIIGGPEGVAALVGLTAEQL